MTFNRVISLAEIRNLILWRVSTKIVWSTIIYNFVNFHRRYYKVHSWLRLVLLGLVPGVVLLIGNVLFIRSLSRHFEGRSAHFQNSSNSSSLPQEQQLQRSLEICNATSPAFGQRYFHVPLIRVHSSGHQSEGSISKKNLPMVSNCGSSMNLDSLFAEKSVKSFKGSVSRRYSIASTTNKEIPLHLTKCKKHQDFSNQMSTPEKQIIEDACHISSLSQRDIEIKQCNPVEKGFDVTFIRVSRNHCPADCQNQVPKVGCCEQKFPEVTRYYKRSKSLPALLPSHYLFHLKRLHSCLGYTNCKVNWKN